MQITSVLSATASTQASSKSHERATSWHTARNVPGGRHGGARTGSDLEMTSVYSSRKRTAALTGLPLRELRSRRK